MISTPVGSTVFHALRFAPAPLSGAPAAAWTRPVRSGASRPWVAGKGLQLEFPCSTTTQVNRSRLHPSSTPFLSLPRLQKHTLEETLKLVVPAHRPIERSTLSHILKQARLTAEQLERLL